MCHDKPMCSSTTLEASNTLHHAAQPAQPLLRGRPGVRPVHLTTRHHHHLLLPLLLVGCRSVAALAIIGLGCSSDSGLGQEVGELLQHRV
jgi:hypothetical protein